MAAGYPDAVITAGMMAVISSTTYTEAADLMRDQGHEISESTLRRWCTKEHAVRFEKLREDYGPRIEASLANELLGNARLAAETERLAIEAARTELLQGEARDPAKIARDLSQVKAQSVDKRLALQGRPTQITEKRDLNEVVRALVGMGVVQVAQQPPVIDATAASVRPAPKHPHENHEAVVLQRQLDAVAAPFVPPPQPAPAGDEVHLAIYPAIPPPEPEAPPRQGEMVWSEELGRMTYESTA